MANDKNIVTKTNDGYVIELFIKNDIQAEELTDGITLLEEKKLTEQEYLQRYSEIAQKYDDQRIMIKIEDKENKEQMKAILQVAKGRDVSLMFSGIATVEELIQVKELLEVCKVELKLKEIPYKNNIKVGVIVEIPSVALNAYETARECDFFFIETNGLTKYTFGNNKRLSPKSELYTKFNLGIIKLFQQATDGAHDSGIFCGISGDVIENEIYLPLLIGLGIDEFTIAKNNIKAFRETISKIDKSDCKEIVEEIKYLTKEEDIEKKLKQFIEK